MNQAEFARHRGVSKAIVTKWKGQGLLKFTDDGLVDVDATEWELDQRPAKYRGGVSHRPIRATVREEPDPREKPERPKVKPAPRAAEIPAADDEPVDFDPDEAMFSETWDHASRNEIAVRDWGIDSSGFTAEVYAFVRSQAGRGNVHAVDGQDSYASAFLGVGGKDTNAAGKKLRRGLKLLRIGASFCKQELMGCLALQRPGKDKPFPAGFVHLPQDVTEDQVKQLTAEELVTHITRGRTRREWVPIGGRRNEVLDCANYARGLAAMRGWDRWREGHWREIEAALGIERGPIIQGETELPPVIEAGSLAERAAQAARALQRPGRRSRVRNRKAW